MLHNWAGNVAFSTTDVKRPRSVAELQDIVATTPRVSALGTGHSFNRIADTAGTLVSLSELALPTEVLSGPVAVVSGGATYAAVSAALHARGWALHNLGSLPHISIAGACSTGTHGSGDTNGSLATAVVGVEFVRADGELVEIHAGDPRFPGAVLALGALGVVTRLWVRIEPTFEVAQDVLVDVPLERVINGLDAILASAYSVSVFTSFARRDTVDSIWFKQKVPIAADDLTAWGGQSAHCDVHPLRGMDPQAATPQRGRPGAWHERLPHFRNEFTPSVGDELQSEFFVDRTYAGAALSAVRSVAEALDGALQVLEVRSIAADDLWLSPFRHRDSVAVHATWVSDIDVVRPALCALESALSPFEPRPHWAKVSLGFDAGRLRGLYPMIPSFRELAERLDPEHCFANPHLTTLGIR